MQRAFLTGSRRPRWRRVAVAFYWERHPGGPFVTLISVASNYLDPENYDLEDLQDRLMAPF
jgi:hypothetical protein